MRGTIMSGTRPDDLRPGTELFVNGNRENSNNYLYDGIDNNTRLTLVIVMRPNVEAIKEFKVQTNLYSAEQGRNPGGQINVVTKSGGNTFHGRRSTASCATTVLDANNFFANRAGQPKPPFKQHQFGGAIGGPIVRNRTFFFTDYDGFRQDLGPGVRERRCRRRRCGGATSARSARHLRSADDGRPAQRHVHAPALPRQRHSAPSRWDPVTAKLMNAYPAADLAGPVQQPRDDADAHAGLEPVRRAASITRQSANDNFLGRYSRSKTATTNPYTFPRRAARRPVEGGRARQRGHLRRTVRACSPSTRCSAGSHVFSPRLVLDSRFGYNHFDLDFTQADVEVGDQLGEQLGVPNANQQDEQAGIPIFSPGRLHRASGTAGRCRSCATRRTFQLVANLTYAADKHTIKAGFDVRRRHMGEFQTNRGNGRFNFSSNITNNPANNTGGHAMASFLLGAPSLIEQDYLLADVAIRGTEYSVYFSDDWRATSKLTLNLGLRYELDTPCDRDLEHRGRTSIRRRRPCWWPGATASARRPASTPTRRCSRRALGFAYHARRRAPSCAAAPASSGTRPATAATPCACTGTCPFGPIYSFNPGNQFVSRRVSDGFSDDPAARRDAAPTIPSGSVIGVDPNYRPGYAQQFNLTVERELPASLLLKTSYVGNIGRHLDTDATT